MVLAVLPEGKGIGLAQAFEEAHAEIAWITPASSSNRVAGAKMKAVLHADGESHFEQISENDPSGLCANVPQLASKLHHLNFLNSMDDPLVPAIAKFFHTNRLGPVTVWPDALAYFEMDTVFQSARRTRWQKNPGNLAFVLPVSISPKGSFSQLGSKKCAQMVAGGGPFILKSSSAMVSQILSRLQFLDSNLNYNMGEAIDVFVGLTLNHRNLRSIGLLPSKSLDTYSKQALLHTAFMSGRVRGDWNTPPSDKSVREAFVSRGITQAHNSSDDLIMQAMKDYACKHRLPVLQTYNAMVAQIARHLDSEEGAGRRPSPTKG